MSNLDRADKDRAIREMQEAIISVINMLDADPDGDASPFTLGTASAHAAFAALESGGFVITKRSK